MLNAIPAVGAVFAGWSGVCTGSGACNVNTSGNAQVDVSATFVQLWDVDGNGQVDALTDGLILIRYMFGLRGPSLTAGAIGVGATRTAEQIEAYIQSVMP